MADKSRGNGYGDVTVGDLLTVDVEAPVAGGQCIARLDGRVVFVRDAIPGERVEARITGTGKRGGFMRADTQRVISASPHRVVPPCQLARECGGCDWQHVDVDCQCQLKQRVIVDAFKRTGGIAAISGRPIEDSFDVERVDRGNGLGWRTRMRYAITSAGEIGLRAGRSHRVIPAADCPLADDRIRRGVADYVAPLGARTLIAAGTVLVTDQQLDTGDVPVIEEQVSDRNFRVAAAGFWQVHPLAAHTLVEAVLRMAEVRPGDRILDLYSGVGLFASFLAEATTVTGLVDAVEGDKIAAGFARSNLADLPWVHHHRADVERWLSQGHRASADVVVLDPPRAGVGRSVVHAIAARKPRTIIYVSCDAVTLARDAAYFRERGFDLTSLRAFDLFPMTKHVECVATFTK